ncbi:MAG TPA: hypothetical protein VM095_19905 [Pyrinomonadaceae bacterium]|nr:hypothetical protein [Pyrinomonadaceae bacterium]
MRSKSLLKLPLLLFALLCLGGVTAQAFTITRTSSPIFYIDTGANQRGMYVSYQILNNSATSYSDVWVGVDTFTGGFVSLAPGEDGLVQLGAMAPGQMKTAYFYLQASGQTNTGQSHTVRVYSARPPSAQIDSATFTQTAVEETIQANANKITTTVSGPNPPGLGGIVTVQVTGHSGTIGSQNLLSFTPACELDWVANNYQLLTTTITLSGGNTGTYTDKLFLSGLPSPSDTNYTIIYSFRATGVSIAPQRVTPMVYIASGTNIKHTQGDPQPISAATNGLTLTKLVNPSQVYVGGTVTYTLRLNNSSGPYDVTVDDLVDSLPTTPGSATYVANSATYNGVAIGNPTISGSTLTWSGGFTVPAGLTRDLTFQATFPNTVGTYTNSAVGHIGGVQIDTTLSTSDNSPATVNTSVVARPDLTVAKSHTGNFTQGQNGATYTITATNSGGSATTGTVTVTDTLPAGLTYVSGAGTGWTCSAAGQTVTCTNSNVVAASTSFPAITLTVNVSASAAASVTNTVSVSGGGETNVANNSASDATTIIQVADLTIGKTHSGNFTQGQSGSYTITVTNSGPGPTSSTVTVTDTLPAGLSYVSATGTGWSCSAAGQVVTCTNTNTLNAGASYPAIALGVNVAANAPFNVTNSVTVSGGGELNTANDSATDATTINGVPDLTITKSHTGNFTQGQSNATYTITVSNSGTAATSGTVTVTDTLPAGLTFVSGSAAPWSCSAVGQVVTCTRSDALAPASSYPALTLTVNVSATAPASVTNTASVTGGGETNTGNNSASDATTINQLPDLTIVKTHTGNFTRGSNGSYTITVTNAGATATNGTTVTVSDTLPAGLTPGTATGTGWTCNTVGQTVTCTRTTVLNAGLSYAAINVPVTVTQSAAASLTNTASASGGGQVNTSNDTASDPTTIVSSSDLSLTKVTNNSGNGLGTNATFTVTLTNTGPSDATGVTVRDQLPAGLTYMSSTPSVGSYNSGTGVWTVGNVASGVSPTLVIVARIDALGSITNTAQVTASNQPDPDSTPNNNVASEDDQASSSLSTQPPSITLCKTVQGQPCPPVASLNAQPGSDLTYVITFTNSGGSYASSFVVTDPVPQYTDFKVGSVATNLATTGLTVSVLYSYDNGNSFVPTLPTSGGGSAPAGYDRTVTHVRWQFTGNLSHLAPNNSGSCGFTVRIQ